jgi:hypothetical protein
MFRCAGTATSGESACRDRQSCLLAKKLLQTLCFAFPARPTASNTFYCIPKTRQRRGTPRNAMVEEKKFWSNGFDDLKHPPPALFTHDPCTNPGPWGTPDAWACVGAEWMMCPETWEQPYKQWSPPSAKRYSASGYPLEVCIYRAHL